MNREVEDRAPIAALTVEHLMGIPLRLVVAAIARANTNKTKVSIQPELQLQKTKTDVLKIQTRSLGLTYVMI